MTLVENEESKGEFPPWISQTTKDMYFRVQALLKAGGSTKLASEIKHAYYHTELLEFANWIQINNEELEIRYNLLSEIEYLI